MELIGIGLCSWESHSDFSIPLKQQSQNVLTKDTEVSDLQKFSDKFLQQLGLSYKKSPYKDTVLDYSFRETLTSRHLSISELAYRLH